MKEIIDIPDRIVIDVDASSPESIRELIMWLMDKRDVEYSLQDYIYHSNQSLRRGD